MSIYLIILLGSFAVPLALSFDKKLQFYRKWNVVWPAIFLVAFIYIAWDIFLTGKGVWGFNPEYHSNLKMFGLPIEEWLFFFVIPYASLFLHFAFVLYFPKIKLPKNITRFLTIALIIFFMLVVIKNYDRLYTTYILSFTIAVLLLSLFDKTHQLEYYYITFLIILIPFFIVNSVLTGTFIEDEVVWYNNSENLGIRILTIPVEDFSYAFSMILLNLQLIALFSKKRVVNQPE